MNVLSVGQICFLLTQLPEPLLRLPFLIEAIVSKSQTHVFRLQDTCANSQYVLQKQTTSFEEPHLSALLPSLVKMLSTSAVTAALPSRTKRHYTRFNESLERIT